MMIPTTLGLLLPAFPAEQRPVAIGIWSAVSGVAAALGPPIGGLLVAAQLALDLPRQRADRPGSTAFAAMRILDEAKEPEDGRPDLLGASVPGARHRPPHARHRPGPGGGHLWPPPSAYSALVAATQFVAAFLTRPVRTTARR